MYGNLKAQIDERAASLTGVQHRPKVDKDDM